MLFPFIAIDKIGKTCCYERITRSHKRDELNHPLSSHVQVSHQTISQNGECYIKTEFRSIFFLFERAKLHFLLVWIYLCVNTVLLY